jgi:hypothetical protein
MSYFPFLGLFIEIILPNIYQNFGTYISEYHLEIFYFIPSSQYKLNQGILSQKNVNIIKKSKLKKA